MQAMNYVMACLKKSIEGFGRQETVIWPNQDWLGWLEDDTEAEE